MKKFPISLILLLGFNIGCEYREIISNHTSIKEELSFTTTKIPDRDMSLALGIQNFTKGELLNSQTFTFEIIAEYSSINAQLLNLDGAKVTLEKLALSNYRITSNFPEIGTVSLTFNKHDKIFTYKLNDEEFYVDIVAPSDAKTQLALAILSNLYIEATQITIPDTLMTGRVQKKYYGYTVGWGLTAEESVDHEATVRTDATENIKKYNCKYLGTSTTCIIGSIGCTTISTYSCDDGVAQPE